MEITKIGIIGCGNIAPAYVKGCRQFQILEIAGCADIEETKAAALGTEYGIKVFSVDELIADTDIDIIINLTIPAAHTEVSLQAIRAGKHVYSEKPLAITLEDGKKIIDAATEKGVRVGCAPDTFLGGGLQTCRKLIDDGWIGEPVAATAFMTNRGHESWHPNPFFYYQPGGGPMLDMGPYYLTALINLLGPIKSVVGIAKKSFTHRTITSHQLWGQKITVNVPTHYSVTLDFENGALGTMIMSFDIWSSNLPRIEIYGSDGSLSVPDPNTFEGPIHLRRPGADNWQEIPLTHSSDVRRGVGVADLAYAVKSGRPHRANGNLALHVLEVMTAFTTNPETQPINIQHKADKPAALPLGLLPGNLDY